MTRGMLTVAEVDEMVATATIDTVLVVLPRPAGPAHGQAGDRPLLPRPHGLAAAVPIEACNYLLAVDVDMTPLPGYEFANWEPGYGDFRCMPDLATLRRIPWLEATALVLCDLARRGDAASRSRCRPAGSCNARSSAPRRWATRSSSRRSSSSSCSASRSTKPRRRATANLTPHSGVDRGLPHPPDDPRRVPHPRRSATAWTTPASRSSSRRARPGEGQHEINLVYADALEMADRHVIYKNGAKEIASPTAASLTFMAKYSMDEVGSSCHVHSSVWDADAATVADVGATTRPTTCRPCSAAGSAA